MKKRSKIIITALLVLSLFFSVTGCSLSNNSNNSVSNNTNSSVSNNNSTDTNTATSTSSAVSNEIITGSKDESMFSSGDTKEITDSEYDGEIDLSTLTSNYKINTAGTYHVTGSSTDYQLIISTPDTETKNVHLVLDNVTMINSKTACIYVVNSEKTIIHLVGNNTITTTYSTKVADGTSYIDGAIHAKDDLTITGEGKMVVNSKLHGIVCKNDLKITGGTVIINSAKKGIDANDSVRISDGDITIMTTAGDGIHIENSDNDAFFYMEGGSLNIDSAYDGIDLSTSDKLFTGYFSLVGGEINIKAGGGYTKSTSSSNSTKGIKSDNELVISGGSVTINSSDDALHAASTITISDGILDLKTGDDGIHSDTKSIINGGTITINAHEGIEGKQVEINGGTMTIVASDDGINASTNITVNGGYIDITMGNGDVDGIDSNGTFTQTGGFIIARVSGVNEMAAPLDTDGTVKITGGTFIALGAFNTSNSTTSIPSVRWGESSFGGGNMGFGRGGMGGGMMGPGQSQSSSSVSFQVGTYTVSGTDITFTLTTTYSNLAIVSDKLSVGTSYILYLNGSSCKTWSQSQTSVTAS